MAPPAHPAASGKSEADSASTPTPFAQALQMAGLNDSALQPNAAKADGNLAANGLAQALLAAGFSDPASSLPISSQDGLSTSAGLQRRAKAVTPETKDESKSAVAAPVITPLPPTTSPLPLRLHAFSREAGNQEQPSRAHSSSSKESSGLQQPEIAAPAQTPVDAPPVSAATQAASETNKPALDRTAGADAAPPPNPLTPQNSPLAPVGDLAFAARVQPASAADSAPAATPRPLQNENATSVQAQARKITENNNAPDPAVVQPVAAGAGASLASYGHSSANAEVPAPAPAAAAVPAAPSQPVEAPEPKVLEAQSKPAVPLKDISLQEAPPGDEKV